MPAVERAGRLAAMKTAIRGGTIIAFDGAKRTVVRSGVVVYEDNTAIHVGEECSKALCTRQEQLGKSKMSR